MSYPRSLDEFEAVELIDELQRRAEQDRKGACDYCGGPLGSEPSCRFPHRHAESGVQTAERPTTIYVDPAWRHILGDPDQ